MGKVVVDTEYLQGYAKQLRSIEGAPADQLRRYIRSHYRNTDGMVGWLEIAIPRVDRMADIAVGVVDQTTRGLSGTSCALDSAAHQYDRQDAESARQILAKASDLLPDGYVEVDKSTTRSSFSTGLSVDMPPPEEVKKAPKYRKALRAELTEINPWIKSITGCDVLAQCLKVVEPEWGALDRVGEAYLSGEKWYETLAKDVRIGMDTLSIHWTDGEASAAFDHHIREEWVPYLNSAAMHERVGGELCIYVAAATEWIVGMFVGYVVAFADFLKKAKAALIEFNADDYWDMIKEVARVVIAYANLVRQVTKGLSDVTKILDEAASVGFDGAHLWADIVTGKNKVPALGE